MGRPLKIKISDTQDAGFNNPDGNGTPSGELYFGQVGGNSNLSSASFPTTTCRVKIGAVSEAEDDNGSDQKSKKSMMGGLKSLLAKKSDKAGK